MGANARWQRQSDRRQRGLSRGSEIELHACAGIRGISRGARRGQACADVFSLDAIAAYRPDWPLPRGGEQITLGVMSEFTPKDRTKVRRHPERANYDRELV